VDSTSVMIAIAPTLALFGVVVITVVTIRKQQTEDRAARTV